jgi:hypothetical protein
MFLLVNKISNFKKIGKNPKTQILNHLGKMFSDEDITKKRTLLAILEMH